MRYLFYIYLQNPSLVCKNIFVEGIRQYFVEGIREHFSN